jgi:hypothetical protein
MTAKINHFLEIFPRLATNIYGAFNFSKKGATRKSNSYATLKTCEKLKGELIVL